MEIDFKSLPLYKTSEFFSCLFVKFVLYTAGFLGEGTLPFFYLQPQKNDLESYISNVFNCFVYVEIVYAGSGFLKIIRNLEAVFLTIIIKNIK